MRIRASCISLIAVISLMGAPVMADGLGSTPPLPDDGVGAPVRISAGYSSSVLVFRVGTIVLNADITETDYRADVTIRAAGLASLFSDLDLRANVEGHLTPAGPVPVHYGHNETTPSKTRLLDVDFTENVALAHADPPFGSLGIPPASTADRTGVLDPMTAFFALSETLAMGERAACEGRVPVFDGKQRYNLRLEPGGREQIRTRAWSGEASVCRAWYEPVSGYDPEDYPTEAEMRRPLTIWLAPLLDGQLQLPVRIYTRAGLGGVTIEAKTIELEELE